MSDLFAMKSVRIADKNLFILLHSCSGHRSKGEYGGDTVDRTHVARHGRGWGRAQSPCSCGWFFCFGCRKCNAKCLPPLQLFIMPRAWWQAERFSEGEKCCGSLSGVGGAGCNSSSCIDCGCVCGCAWALSHLTPVAHGRWQEGHASYTVSCRSFLWQEGIGIPWLWCWLVFIFPLVFGCMFFAFRLRLQFQAENCRKFDRLYKKAYKIRQGYHKMAGNKSWKNHCIL